MGAVGRSSSGGTLALVLLRRMEPESTLRPVSDAAKQQPEVIVRPLAPGDSMAELTSLLHRAYAKQVEMGLRPLAGRQTEEVTRQRTASGETIVAELEGRLVGMILLNEREDAAFPGHFLRPNMAHFSLLAVDPGAQGRGIGKKLLEKMETRARELGHTALSLSMAEPDAELMKFYERLGFRFVEYWRWPYTNYNSVILGRDIH